MNVFQKQLVLSGKSMAEIHNGLSGNHSDDPLEDYSCLVGPVELPLSEKKVTFEEFLKDMRSVKKG